MKEKKLLRLKSIKVYALWCLSFASFSAQAQTNVTVDATDTWQAAMLVHENTEAQEFMWFSEWGVADLKTEINTAENTITLYPNYGTYGTGMETDPTYWQIGENGNKIMEAITYTIDDSLLNQNINFSGTITSNTLTSAYTVRAFVKVLNTDWGLIHEEVIVLNEPGNFTVPFNAAMYPDTVHLQYGFIVRGINANPVTMEANGNMVITAGEPVTARTVSIDTTSALIAYANWFQLDGTSYINGSEWGINDIKTVVNASNNVIDLHPNFSAYTDEVTNRPNESVFHNGEIGNCIFEGNTYVQDDTLAGEAFTYTGHTISNTLATGYTAVAFIKIFDANYANMQMTTEPLVGGEDFSISATPAPGSHVQYGYTVKGLNASPTQLQALGFARVGQQVAGIKTIAKNAVTVYPNPVQNMLNLASQDVIENVSIYNMLGQNVYTSSPENNNTTVNVSGLNNGLYIVNVLVNGKPGSVRFVKK